MRRKANLLDRWSVVHLDKAAADFEIVERFHVISDHERVELNFRGFEFFVIKHGAIHLIESNKVVGNRQKE